MSDLPFMLIQNFLKSSGNCIEILIRGLHNFQGKSKWVNFFVMDGNKRRGIQLDGSRFFLRASTEYANPQLTLEELQGIIAARLLEVCCNYMYEKNLTSIKNLSQNDFLEISEALRKPSTGKIASFILNTDDVEPDRYSANPLRKSIVESGQSAFPAASVITDDLRIDNNFVAKYDGSLISKDDLALIERCLLESSDRYVDFVDMVKYEMLREASDVLDIDLCIPALRMPLEMLKEEKPKDPLHLIIEECHSDYEMIKTMYELMGRNIAKRKTLLLTVPHSQKGFGSKRAAKGKIIFKEDVFEQIKVKYATTPLYPNMVDYNDLSLAVADDEFSINASKIKDYGYAQTPSSPQFALYAALSPEDAAIWHGVGWFSGIEIVKSYISIRAAHLKGKIFKSISPPSSNLPLQFNLVPEKMWLHPKYNNLDASVSCIQDLWKLVNTGVYIAPLSIRERSDDEE